MNHFWTKLCLILVVLGGSATPSLGETITLAYDSNLRPDPCSNQSLGRIAKGTNLKMQKKAFLYSGAIRTQWFEVVYSGKKGWISDQNTTKPTKPNVDTSRIGKPCRWEEQ